MSVAHALRRSSQLAVCVQPGKQAMASGDRARVVEKGARVRDSLALDVALKKSHGSDSRWDYLLGVDQSVIGVEVHPANAGEVQKLVRKKAAAVSVLATEMTGGGDVVRRWYWIASGSDTISRNSPEFRRLAKSGILLVGARLTL